MLTQEVLKIKTPGRGLLELSAQLTEITKDSGIELGICHLFLHHTSASLIICENADINVQRDLEGYMERLVIDGDPLFRHDQEGPDDMSAHIRTILTQSALSIPITRKRLALGTWQGIYLWEHRLKGSERMLTITLMGEQAASNVGPL